jgi:hypothetical protein
VVVSRTLYRRKTIGIILREEPHAWETRFFTVILPDGNTELFSENNLEVVPTK